MTTADRAGHDWVEVVVYSLGGDPVFGPRSLPGTSLLLEVKTLVEEACGGQKRVRLLQGAGELELAGSLLELDEGDGVSLLAIFEDLAPGGTPAPDSAAPRRPCMVAQKVVLSWLLPAAFVLAPWILTLSAWAQGVSGSVLVWLCAESAFVLFSVVACCAMICYQGDGWPELGCVSLLGVVCVIHSVLLTLLQQDPSAGYWPQWGRALRTFAALFLPGLAALAWLAGRAPFTGWLCVVRLSALGPVGAVVGLLLLAVQRDPCPGWWMALGAAAAQLLQSVAAASVSVFIMMASIEQNSEDDGW